MSQKYPSHFFDPPPAKYARLKASFDTRPSARKILAYALLALIGLAPLLLVLDCSLARTVKIAGPLQNKYYEPPHIHEHGSTSEKYWFEVGGKKATVLQREYDAHKVGDIVELPILRGRFTGWHYSDEWFFDQ